MEDPCRAWKAFATCALPLFPVLVRQMQAVTRETEQAALDLVTKLREIAQRAGGQAEDAMQIVSQAVQQDTGEDRLEQLLASAHLAKQQASDLSQDVGQIVMALQFQDITRQKLEHVEHALTQLQDHFQHLVDGRPDQDVEDSLSLLRDLEHRYTMQAERQIHAEANGQAVEPAPPAEDSVTLF